MTTSDWIIDIALLLIVLLQLRGERLSARTIVVPLTLIGWVTFHYLTDIPTAGNDVPLMVGFATAGVVFGLAGGLLTRVRYTDGRIFVRATWSAAALWVLSMGFRLGFAVWTSHPSGEAHVARFSAGHDITSVQAWVAALIMMAFGEVVVRLGTIVIRGRMRAAHGRRATAGPTGTPAAPTPAPAGAGAAKAAGRPGSTV